MSASGVTLETGRIAGDLRALSDELAKPERLVEDILPVVAFRLREIRFLMDNLASLITQADREYESWRTYEPPFHSDGYGEWLAEHHNIREPAY